MEFINALRRYKAANPNELLNALTDIEQSSIDAANEASRAYDAYFADVADKERKIESRVASLSEQRALAQTKMDTLKKQVANATVNDDYTRLANYRDDMKNLEDEMTQLSAETDALKHALIPGDETLYQAALVKFDRFCEALKQYNNAKLELYTFACEMGVEYEKIEKATQNYNSGGGRAFSIDKLNAHFYAEEFQEYNAHLSEGKAAQAGVESCNRRVQIYAPTFKERY